MLKDKTRIFRKPMGPIVVQGPVELTDHNGKILNTKSTFSLCGCGRSSKLPFCDGTHKKPTI